MTTKNDFKLKIQSVKSAMMGKTGKKNPKHGEENIKKREDHVHDHAIAFYSKSRNDCFAPKIILGITQGVPL